MKKVILLLSMLLLASFVSAAISECTLSVSLVNQDPYPATPGEYVKLLFQVEGVQDSTCGDVEIELIEKYPLIFDPNTTRKVSLRSGTFVKDYSTHLIVPYKVRVDPDALDGDNPIEVQFSNNLQGISFLSKEFNLYIEETRANFEVYVKNFDPLSKEITLEILNTAKSSVSAVTLELLDSENLQVFGSKTRIIGDLDSNEYTTSDFTIASEKADIPLKLLYTDSAGIRRSTQASFSFNPDNFVSVTPKSSPVKYYVLLIIILGAGYWLYKKRKNKKKN